jgi:hypothetical protein
MALLMSPSVRDALSTVLQPYIFQRYGQDPTSQEIAAGSVSNTLRLMQCVVLEQDVSTSAAIEVLQTRQLLGVSMNMHIPKRSEKESEKEEEECLFKIAEVIHGVVSAVVGALVAIGFTLDQSANAAHHALRCVLKDTLHLGWGPLLHDSLKDVALEYLCLTIEEQLLPEVSKHTVRLLTIDMWQYAVKGALKCMTVICKYHCILYWYCSRRLELAASTVARKLMWWRPQR